MQFFFGQWQFYALGSALFAAMTAILAKMALVQVNSNLATFIRTIVILILSAMVVSWRSQWLDCTRLTKNTLLFLVLSGLATGASWLCYYRALQLAPASLVAPIDKLSVVLVILLGYLLLGETLSWPIIAGAALILAGVLILCIFAG